VATARSLKQHAPGHTANYAITSETATASITRSAGTFTNSTPSSANHCQQTKPTKSPPVSTNGSPHNHASGPMAQPSTKPLSAPSKPHAAETAVKQEPLISARQCLISLRKANDDHPIQTSTKRLECPRTRRENRCVTQKHH